MTNDQAPMTNGVPDNAFVHRVVVSERDIDEQGHASNVSAVRWMNQAAWAHSVALGWHTEAYKELGAWFVVRRHEIDYKARAMEGDELEVRTWPSGLAKATAERRHVIVRPSDGAVIATGFNVWAFIDVESARPRRIPEHVRDAFDPTRWERA